VTHNHAPSYPDVSIISSNLLLSSVWSTRIGLNSDHLPITVNFTDDLPPPRSCRTFTNLRLADWAGFIAECELRFETEPLPTCCAGGEKVFRSILLAASSHHIPSGHRKTFIPGLPHDAIPLINRRDELRSLDPDDPEITELNSEITKRIGINSRNEWISKVETCKPNSHDFWSLLRGLSGKRSFQPPNQPLMFGDKVFNSAPVIAKRFTHQFLSIGQHKSDPNTRRVISLMHRNHKLNRSFAPFTTKLTDAAIRRIHLHWALMAFLLSISSILGPRA
jgi:hypothetical protein